MSDGRCLNSDAYCCNRCKRAERAEAKVKELMLKVHQLEVHYALFAGQAFPYTGLEPGDDHG